MRFPTAVAVLSLAARAAAPRALEAQEPRNNVIYGELLGNGGASSINYERRIGSTHLRVGYGSWSSGDLFGAGSTSYKTFPITISKVRGSGNHHLEAGGGITIGSRSFSSSFGSSSDEDSSFQTITGIAGYRYQKPDGALVFRAVLTPLYGLGDLDTAYPDKGFFMSLGVSLGIAF